MKALACIVSPALLYLQIMVCNYVARLSYEKLDLEVETEKINTTTYPNSVSIIIHIVNRIMYDTMIYKVIFNQYFTWSI
jgi:hypothetical protein